jgi:hypothetical protein
MGEVNDSYCIPEIKGTGIESDETAVKFLLLRIKLTEALTPDSGKVAGEVFPRLINILDEFFVLLQCLRLYYQTHLSRNTDNDKTSRLINGVIAGMRRNLIVSLVMILEGYFAKGLMKGKTKQWINELINNNLGKDSDEAKAIVLLVKIRNMMHSNFLTMPERGFDLIVAGVRFSSEEGADYCPTS